MAEPRTRRKPPATTADPDPAPLEAPPAAVPPDEVLSKTPAMMRLAAVQERLNVPKNRTNKFGGYNYRSAEDILKAAKDLCIQWGLLLSVTDRLVHTPGTQDLNIYPGEKSTFTTFGGDHWYICATARVYDIYSGDLVLESDGWAREEETKKGMDASQLSGATSSYARKYALNGLLAIDDSKDADTDEYAIQTGRTEPRANGTTTPRTNDQIATDVDKALSTASADIRQNEMAKLHIKGEKHGLDHDALRSLMQTVYPQFESLTELSADQIKALANMIGTPPGDKSKGAPTTFTDLWQMLRTQGIKGQADLVKLIGQIDPEWTATEIYNRYRAHVRTTS